MTTTLNQSDENKPNIDEARRFLLALDPSDQFTFQTFDDSKEKHKRFVKIFHGSLEKCFGELNWRNEDGAGVFVTVNRTDGLGRRRQNIKQVRAIFLDLDGAPLEPV